MAVVLLCAVGATATSLAGPWLIRSLIGLLEGGEGWSVVGPEISWLVLALAGAFVLRAGFLFLVGYLAHIVAWSFVSDVTVALSGIRHQVSGKSKGSSSSSKPFDLIVGVLPCNVG